MKKRILVTGACGFIGHHIAEHLLLNTDWEIIGIDRLSYAANGFDRLRDAVGYPHERVTLFSTDFTQQFPCGLIKEIGEVDYILHMGAETHVDNSITNPEAFVFANVVGTFRVLEFARQSKSIKKFIYFSTDEVFGPAPQGIDFEEGDPYNSSNPYSATKAAGECLCVAYANTYKMPVSITNTMNVCGERQNEEKYIPKVIRKVLLGELVEIHANPELTKAGSRFYIHARNVADAILFIFNNIQENLDIHDITKGKFNIVGEKEFDNLELAKFIAKVVGKPLNYKLVNFHQSRPGHDLRYALSGKKLKSLGWEPPKTIEKSLEKSILWYLSHKDWLGI